MSPNEQDDPVRKILAAAVGTVIDMMPESYARKVVIEELMSAEARVKARLIRRYVH